MRWHLAGKTGGHPVGTEPTTIRDTVSFMAADLESRSTGKTGDLDFLQSPTFYREDMDLAGGVEGSFLESAGAKRPLQEEQSLCLGTAAGLGGAPCRGPGGLSGKHGLHGGNKASGGWPRVHSMPPQGPTPPLPWHCSVFSVNPFTH